MFAIDNHSHSKGAQSRAGTELSFVTFFSKKVFLFGAFISPEENMEAGGEAVGVVAADVGEPEGAGLEGGGIAAFGHEVDAI